MVKIDFILRVLIRHTVNRAQAGQAELVLTVTDKDGHAVPFEIRMTDYGETAKYVPQTSGTYVVNVTLGGVTVPGAWKFFLFCSVVHEIVCFFKSI